MKVVFYSDSKEKTKEALDSGCDIVLTMDLEDMTDPTRTIYVITGASFTDDINIAKQHGYLNIRKEPLKIYDRKQKDYKYPIAINSDIYIENFNHRLKYLKEFTKLPYGLHVGGSHNMFEHCIPEGRGSSNEYWCYGFKQTHKYDPNITLSQYQADVWEEEMMNMMDMALNEFPNIYEITTAFKCPSKAETRKTACMMTSGEELWGVLRHLSFYEKWHNFFFSFFDYETNAKIDSNKLIWLKHDLERNKLKDRIYIGAEGNYGILGDDNNKNKICDEAQGAGTGFLAYMIGCHAGIIGDFHEFNEEVIESIKLVQKYPTFDT